MKRLLVCFFIFSGLRGIGAGIDTRFSIDGVILGKDTGTIVFWYFDQFNKGVQDTIRLDRGKFHFEGTVNRVCEGMIWTDLRNRSFDDSSVIRFLLGPGETRIVYDRHHGSHPRIDGFAGQEDKDRWYRVTAILQDEKERRFEALNAAVSYHQ